ncbi:MAG TPA: hypothetical protein VED85_07980, partial [Burkholderiaceae bacterium]|nr:hypothetical protein [Burkholderiaceae bacterium]
AALIEAAHRQYLPSRVLAMAAHTVLGEGRESIDGLPTAYVCRERSCLPPVTSVAELLEALR